MTWPRDREPFFIQQHDRGPWHVETPDDPEQMLCGIRVSVEDSVKIQKRWGLKPCLWCKRELELRLGSSPSSSPSGPTT